MGQDSYQALVEGMQVYFDALYHADSEALGGIFHADARYINTVPGDYMNYSIPEYLAIVDQRVPPADTGQIRNDKLISIELGGSDMAFVTASMSMLNRDYLDFLTFIHADGRWQIITKVFSYTNH